jgi:hypothetical protein
MSEDRIDDGSLQAFLARAGAQHDLVEWAAPYGADVEALWQACPRGDWALAIAARLGVEPAAIQLAAGRCARLALAYVPDSDPLPERCLDALEAHATGAAGRPGPALYTQLMQAQAGAQDAACAEALLAIASALDALDDPSAAAGAAAFAAHAAMVGTAECAMLEAVRFVQRASAEEARRAIATPRIIERWRARTP